MNGIQIHLNLIKNVDCRICSLAVTATVVLIHFVSYGLVI